MDNWEMGRVTEIGGIFGREEGRSGKGVEQTGETGGVVGKGFGVAFLRRTDSRVFPRLSFM